MPIYEYQCQACGYQFDKLQKISDAALKDCPKCGQPSLQKLISAPSFQLKGTGWYETDFKKSNKAPAKEANANNSKTEKKADKTSTSSSSNSAVD